MGPPLIERIDAPMIVVAGGEVRASPQASGALLFSVSPGASVFVTGHVSAEWMQLRLIDGSFAYLPVVAFTAAPVVNPLPATSNLTGNTSGAPAAASPALAGTGQAAQAPVALAPVAPFPTPAPSPATGLPMPTFAPMPSTPAGGAGQAAAAPALSPSPFAPPAPPAALPVAPAVPPSTATPAPAATPTPAPTPPPTTVTTAPAPAPATPAAPPPQQEALAEPVFVAERGGVLRNAASARALQVAQVRAGQRFTLLKEQRAADGQIWAEVKPIDGAPGFILRKDLIAAEEWDAPVSGAVTRVVDAATLVVGTRTIRLGAVEAGPVRFVEVVRPWLTGAASPLTCERRPDAAFDCFSADRRDVGETMILNGLARAGAGAPAYYLEAQDKAKQAKKGLWRTAR